jgi:hypothetical protein
MILFGLGLRYAWPLVNEAVAPAKTDS